MARAKAGKKKVRTPRATGPVTPRSFDPEKPLLAAEILPAGGVSRGNVPPPKADRVETEEKNYYGETGPQMLGRVRRELRNIAILAVVSFGVGLLAVQLVKF
ncbi:MAG TPA: hypothetical protein VMW83_03225 [Spirochaetia bacterium]|nr:hypothetical protein [Spirochaetia bacterium]